MNNLNPMHSFIENKNNISFSELYKAYMENISECSSGSKPEGRLRTPMGNKMT